jgi:uncharacterized protein YecT (DUF1311 family)
MNVKRASLFFAIILVVLPCLSQTRKQMSKESIDPIESRLEQCIDKDPTTAGMTNCTIQSAEAWDKEMNAVYSKLLNRLDANGKAALLKSQRQWLSFRDSETEFIAAYYAGFQGTMYLPMRAGDRADLIKERTIKLRSYLDTLNTK